MTDDATPIFSVQHGYNGEVEGEDFNERHRIVSIDIIMFNDHPFPFIVRLQWAAAADPQTGLPNLELEANTYYLARFLPKPA